MGIIDCLEVDPEAAIAFGAVIEGFVLTIPDIILPTFATKIPDLPGSVVELFLGNIGGIPAFSVDVPGLGTLAVDGPDLNAGLAIPVFDPEGLIAMIKGLAFTLIGLPELFIDVGPPPVPKVPSKQVVIDLISKSLALPDEPILTLEFKEKLVDCVFEQMGLPI